MINSPLKFQQCSPLPGKIQTYHYNRLAIIYIRQSSLQQVERHTESTKLQYGLVEKAYDLGWSKEKILVIDEDLGRSGANAEGRPGFQRLVAEVGLNHVGIVLGIEISRLARSCRDWYQLLEVCALFKTLIGDTDGIYDPAFYNDRLLLGLKGTMSEAELHILKQRMLAGQKAKAGRGELKMRLPRGYLQSPSGEIIKDPDEQVQSTVQLVFDLFDRYATLGAVLKYLADHKIQLPYRELGELCWRRANRTTLSYFFHNPIYAGAYVYGRCITDLSKRKPGHPTTGRVKKPLSEWAVLIKDKIPAYITWEQYEHNLRQLAANMTQEKGVPRQGSSLLSGLIVCGHCGARMVTFYTNAGNGLRYYCTHRRTVYGESPCQSLVGVCLDNAIVQEVLKALQPCALEVSLKVAEDIEQERKGLAMHWEKKLERARYDVERAYRQYNATEPENRLVIRTLEKKWEEALSAEEKLKKEYAEFLKKQPNLLTQEERDAIRRLAMDIPALWSLPTTTTQERQEMIRLLIERVIVTVEGKTEKVHVQTHWSGGHQTAFYFNRPVAKFEQLSYYSELLTYVKNLREEGKRLSDIANLLNREVRWLPPSQRPCFTHHMIRALLTRGNITSYKTTRASQVSRTDNEFTFGELSQKINVSEATLYDWMRKGRFKNVRRAQGVSHGGIWLVTADEEEIMRLISLRNQPRKWNHHVRVK